MKYKLLALGGPKNFEWLPWDGTNYQLKVPVLSNIKVREIRQSNVSNPVDILDYDMAIYQVDVIGFGPKDKRHIYREITLDYDTAEKMLIQHLLEMFVHVGDIEETGLDEH